MKKANVANFSAICPLFSGFGEAFCDPPSDGTLRAAACGAVFGGQLQQGLRFEGVARTHAGGLPCAHVAVVFGRQAFEERQGAVAQTFAAGVASVGELQDGDEVDSDDVGLERPDALGTFVALGAGTWCVRQ